MAPETSAAPATAASMSESPASRRRAMFSSTTMALSTSSPIASAMPPSDMMFSDRPANCIGRKVTITEIGIATAMISVGRNSRRNRYSTSTASRAP